MYDLTNRPHEQSREIKSVVIKYLNSTYTLRKDNIDVIIAHSGTFEDTTISTVFSDIDENLGFTAKEVTDAFIDWLSAEFVLIENSVTDELFRLHKEMFEGIDVTEKNRLGLTPKMTPKFLVYLGKRRVQYISTIKGIAKVYAEHKIIPKFRDDNDIYY
mgnify:FL=1|jgi:hypothetical protein|tara:strand:- start:1727 stop:2203 length:477 start_codon:yes stop_codon:yes gene_type:complete